VVRIPPPTYTCVSARVAAIRTMRTPHSRILDEMALVRRKGDWLSAMVGEELVMMSAEHGAYLGLSSVGARIWELIEEPREADAICAQLTDEFEVEPETCRAEVMHFLEELASNGAVEIGQEPAR